MIRQLVAPLIVLLGALGPGARAEGDSAVTAEVVAIWQAGQSRIEVSGQTHAAGRPVTAQDAWHVGSLTKSMTATLAARLVVQGRIGWETPIGALLPAADAWADVTLADLLAHRSGIAANLSRWHAWRRPDRAAYVARMLKTRPAGPRGDFLYSNAGYVIAGAMLEAATGRTWEDLITAEVFAPLGMEGAGFGAPEGIWGHAPRPMPPGPDADNLSAMGPAGTVHLPPEAMLRFLAAHASRDPGFLPAEAWAMLHRPRGDYAMGWILQEDALSHAGSNTMWLAQMVIRDRRAVFVAVNAMDVGADARVRALTGQALSADLPARPEGPRP